MSKSSLEDKIQRLLNRINTENSSRDRDPFPRMVDSPSISPRNPPPLDLSGLNTGTTGTPTRSRLNLPVSFQHRSIDSKETDDKLKEIMKISGILTIGGVEYPTQISDLEHLGELGNGTCGHVVKMRHKPTGTIIAVKQMRRSGNNEENKRIIMDIDVVLKSHDCPYIVQCLGCFITESDVWICMELMATCFDKLLKRLQTRIPENVLGKVTFATVKALSYLKEQHDVIHRDVKPSNILVDDKGNVKLCDFGISGRLVDSMAQTRSAGCAAYMAPERIEPPNPSKPDYDIRADVWSLGITLVELATGVFPYKDCKTDFEVLTKVLSEEPPTLPDDHEFSEEFRAFVACCLIKDYVYRPKYGKLLEQPFLQHYKEIHVSVDEWIKRALKQADLLGVNSPGRRYAAGVNIRRPQLSNGSSTYHNHSLPPVAGGHLYQKSPERLGFHHHQSRVDSCGRFSPFQRRAAESPPPSPFTGRRTFEGPWASPAGSPLPLRKAFAESHPNSTSPKLLQRFYHQQKQYQQQQQQQEDGSKDDSAGAKKRFASHIKLQLGGERASLRHQSPEPPPRLSRAPSAEATGHSHSPLPLRRGFLEAGGSPALPRRYVSPSPPQPPPRRLSESSSVPGSPQHFRARFHYTPEPQRRIFRNNDLS